MKGERGLGCSVKGSQEVRDGVSVRLALRPRVKGSGCRLRLVTDRLEVLNWWMLLGPPKPER